LRRNSSSAIKLPEYSISNDFIVFLDLQQVVNMIYLPQAEVHKVTNEVHVVSLLGCTTNQDLARTEYLLTLR
jgi:hypothetical protein